MTMVSNIPRRREAVGAGVLAHPKPRVRARTLRPGLGRVVFPPLPRSRRGQKGPIMHPESSARPVRPISPVVAWIGGKRKLAPKILPWIEAVDHGCYVEPFIGMGGMFLSRRMAPQVEVMNDRNREVFNFFRMVQIHYQPFVEYMRYRITSRAEFERLAAEDPGTLTEIQRAARFLFLQACAYGGKPSGGAFGVSPKAFHGFDLARLGPALDALHSRLSAVIIECLDYADLIRRWDSPDTLFYLDPPYYGSESDYGRELFSRDEFARLAAQLSAIKGRFVLSINDHPAVRQIFSAYRVAEIEATYSIAQQAASKVRELVFIGPKGREWVPARAQGGLAL